MRCVRFCNNRGHLHGLFYLNVTTMTQTLEELLNAKQDWQLTISERLQQAIEHEKQMTVLVDGILDSIISFYPSGEEDEHSQEILDCWYMLENAIDKRLAQQILTESTLMKHA